LRIPGPGIERGRHHVMFSLPISSLDRRSSYLIYLVRLSQCRPIERLLFNNP
jgi:hypothetical protein